MKDQNFLFRNSKLTQNRALFTTLGSVLRGFVIPVLFLVGIVGGCNSWRRNNLYRGWFAPDGATRVYLAGATREAGYLMLTYENWTPNDNTRASFHALLNVASHRTSAGNWELRDASKPSIVVARLHEDSFWNHRYTLTLLPALFSSQPKWKLSDATTGQMQTRAFSRSQRAALNTFPRAFEITPMPDRS